MQVPAGKERVPEGHGAHDTVGSLVANARRRRRGGSSATRAARRGGHTAGMHTTKHGTGGQRWRARGPSAGERDAKRTNATCWRCRAVRVRGRWTHGARLDVPADICLPATLCSSCVAIRQHVAGHVLTIEGLPDEHLREVAAVIRNAAAAEHGMRCTERLVYVRRRGARMTVGTTGKHLAGRIGAVLLRAWKADLHTLRHDESVTVLVWGRSEQSARPRPAARRRSR